MELTEYLEVIAFDIAFWMAGLRNPEYPVEQLGDLCVDVTAKLRAAAIIALVTNADPDTFFHNLVRSAHCRLVYLERLRDAGKIGDHHQGSARVEPLLDAVTAEDFAVARRIAALSPSIWLDGHEYEDDYCFAQIVHGLIAPPGIGTQLEPLFARFEKALEGAPDARLDVTRALARRDQAAFNPAFEGLIAQRTLRIDADKARSRIEEPGMMAERQVYVEGLALLRIATRLGLSSESEYLYCPSIARVRMQKPFPGE